MVSFGSVKKKVKQTVNPIAPPKYTTTPKIHNHPQNTQLPPKYTTTPNLNKQINKQKD